MKRLHLIVSLVLVWNCCLASISSADFVEKWSSSADSYPPYIPDVFLDAGNTDSDPQVELLYGQKDGRTLLLLDGATGSVEWLLTGVMYTSGFFSSGSAFHPGGPRLIDVDGDGIDEILFYDVGSQDYRCYEAGVTLATSPRSDVDGTGLQGTPNPFNNSTQIQFTLDVAGSAVVNIYDVEGKLVRRLDGGWKEAGTHALHWDGQDDRNVRLPAGIYLYTLGTSFTKGAKKMVLVR